MCFTRKTKGLPPPTPLLNINAQQMINLLKTACPKALVLLSDSIYSTTTVEELQRFLRSDDTNEFRYVSEYYDCDDFSFRLMGQIHNVEWGALPFGIMWLTKENNVAHALNCFIDDDMILWLIEPQSDQVFLLPNNWTPLFVMI